MGSACSKSRPKYIQHVKALYPKRGQPSGKPQNMSAFIHYSVANPQYLKQIGKYLFHRIQKHIRQGDAGKVYIPIAAMMALIESCDADFTRVEIYQDSVKSAVLLLFSQPNIDYRIFGLDILSKYAHQQSDDEINSARLDPFIPRLVDLVVFDGEPEEKKKVRTAALKTLEQVLLYNDERNSAEHFSVLIPAILENVTSFDEKNNDLAASTENSTSEDSSGLKCFVELSRLVDLTNIAEVMRYITIYLDSKKWSPATYASSCIRTILENSRKIQQGYNVLDDILRHFGAVYDSGKNFLTENILLAISDLILNIRVLIGSWDGLLRFLLYKLQSSAEEEGSEGIRSGILKVIQSYCCRLSGADQLKLLNMVCENLIGENLSRTVKHELLSCALSISLILEDSGDQNASPEDWKCVKSFLSIACNAEAEKDLITYRSSLEILSNILCPPIFQRSSESKSSTSTSKLIEVRLGAGRMRIPAFLSKIAEGENLLSAQSNLLGFTDENRRLLRVFVYKTSIKSPELISDRHFQLLVFALYAETSKEFLETVPLILSFLSTSFDDHFNSRVYALVLSYLQFLLHMISSMMDPVKYPDLGIQCSRLEEHVSKCRSSFNSLSAEFEVNSSKGLVAVERESSTTKIPENTLDRSLLLEILSSCTAMTTPAKKPLIELLADFHPPDLQMFAIELMPLRDDRSEISRSNTLVGSKFDRLGSQVSSGPEFSRTLSNGILPPDLEYPSSNEVAYNEEKKILNLSPSMMHDFDRLTEAVGSKQARQNALMSSVLHSSADNEEENGRKHHPMEFIRKLSLAGEDVIHASPLTNMEDEKRKVSNGSSNSPDKFVVVENTPLNSFDLQDVLRDEDFSDHPGSNTLRRKFPRLTGVNDIESRNSGMFKLNSNSTPN